MVAEQGVGRSSSSARHSTASAPWPTWGSITVGLEHLGDPFGQPEPLQGGQRPPRWRRTRPAWASRVAMLPRSPAKVRSGRSQASWARRRTEPVADSGARRQGVEAASRPGRRGGRPAGGHRRQPQARGGDRREVLGRVDGDVGPPVEHGRLHLLDEDALAADLPRSGRPGAGRPVVDDDDQLDRRRRDAAATRRSATWLACHRASALPRVAIRTRLGTAATAQRSNRSRMASASCSPRAVPAASLSCTVGSWSSLATMPRVSASTASRCRSSSPASRTRKRSSSAGADALRPGLPERGHERRHLPLHAWPPGSARPPRRRWR